MAEQRTHHAGDRHDFMRVRQCAFARRIPDQRNARRDRALQRIEKEDKVARPAPEHATHIRRTRILAADFEDVHTFRARDQITEGQRAQQVSDHGSDEDGREHAGTSSPAASRTAP